MNWQAVFVAAMMAGSSILPSNSVSAQEWEWLPEMTSAKLAAAGWEVKAAAGVNWPDSGLQGVITFWHGEVNGRPLIMRCIDNFNKTADPTGEICAQVPVKGN